MKRKLSLIIGLGVFLALMSCSDILNEQPLNKIPSEQLLESPGGVNTLLARLYSQLPIEDFNYKPVNDFNVRGWQGVGGSIIMTSFYTDEAHRSDGSGIGPVSDSYWPYDDIREVNLFFESLDKVRDRFTEEEYLQLKSEAHFIRAYMYFGLAKRYGGVPLIDRVLDGDYIPGSDNANLYIPRSTEKETWEFILNELDFAIENLPEFRTSEEGVYRATKWAAYGLKSRAALFAASIAKYFDDAPLVGDAVNQELVGIAQSDASFFYGEAISASEAIINQSTHTLYMPNPSSPQEAVNNFYELFMSDNNEIIFKKHFLDGTVNENQGHSYDIFYNPFQTNPGFHKASRFNPTLDLIDIFEEYTNDGVRGNGKIETREDGNEDYALTDPTNVDISWAFKKYDNLFEPFENKDARLLASVILPGSEWKGQEIIAQGGLITPEGNKMIYFEDAITGPDGETYYTYGASSLFSGFKGLGQGDDANYSMSGFHPKKYLIEGIDVIGEMESSDTDWIDIRLAEIYLNYAEAVVESGLGNANRAAELLNDLRERAGHTDEIPLTLENVLLERRVELAFEGHRYWDLVRRRTYHQVFDQTRRKALVPILDLREMPAKYIFVRANNISDEEVEGRTFQTQYYYQPIPGRQTNNLVENPGW